MGWDWEEWLLSDLGLVWMEGNGGKRKEWIWRDGDSLVWIAKMEGEGFGGKGFRGIKSLNFVNIKISP